MLYSKINNIEVSCLGMGSMRLPLDDVWEETSVNDEKVQELVDCAIKNGITYFDTAYDYHWGVSEEVLAWALSKYPRDSYRFVTKCPCEDFENNDSPTVVDDLFKKQLERTKLDYFDFYLMHGLRDNNVTWFEEHIEDFLALKEKGFIKSLGVSCHCSPITLSNFLDKYSDKLDFVQIVFNWYDFYCTDSKKLYQLCISKNLPIIAMIPLKAGRLTHLTDHELENLAIVNKDLDQINWAYNFIKSFDESNIPVILTGMTKPEQIEENIKAFEEIRPLTNIEKYAVERTAYMIDDDHVGCCGCNKCKEVCPQKLDIPKIIDAYNRNTFHRGKDHGIDIWKAFDIEEGDFPKEFEYSTCLGCRQCESVCTCENKISDIMKEMIQSGKNEICDFYW